MARALRSLPTHFLPRLPRSFVVQRLVESVLRPRSGTVRERFSPAFLLTVALCALGIILWRADRTYPIGMHDLYPIYYGAKAWLATGNAYDLAAVAPLADRFHGIYLTGNGYPLPAALLLTPLTLLSPKGAAIVWLGFIVASTLLTLRLAGASCWLILYWPFLEALRLEQYTALVVLFQILALWAYKARRPWLLALCCALMLTKPQQTIFFVLALVFLARNWRQQLAMGALVWGGATLLDPNWLGEWLTALSHYKEISGHPLYWQLGLLALPLVFFRNYLGAAIFLPFLFFVFPIPSPYLAAVIPLAVLNDRRNVWLMPVSYLWFIATAYFGQGWFAVVLTLGLPALLISAMQWRERASAPSPPQPIAPDLQTANVRS